MIWKSKWQVIAEDRMDLIEALRAERDYYRERAERATNALLEYQQKPTVNNSNPDSAAAFLDKNLSFFRDEEGGQEVA